MWHRPNQDFESRSYSRDHQDVVSTAPKVCERISKNSLYKSGHQQAWDADPALATAKLWYMCVFAFLTIWDGCGWLVTTGVSTGNSPYTVASVIMGTHKQVSRAFPHQTLQLLHRQKEKRE